MGFKNTLVVLQAHTDEIKRILERLEQSDEIRSIDLDLILEKLRTVYDVVIDLQEETKSLTKPDEKVEIHEISEQKSDKTVDLNSESKTEVQKKKNEEPVESASTDRKETQTAPKLKVQERSDKETVLSDRFKSEDPTLNEEIGGQKKQENISSQLSANPITSLTGAIGLNEKFELINELFEGDKNKFDRTMQILNSSNSFVEAYSFLEENFEWDMENPYVQRILELIRRKLIVRRNEQ